MKPKFERQKEIFIYRMGKQSIEREIYIITKPLHSWEKGISFEDLRKEVTKRSKRKKSYCENRIREAISLINKFGKDYSIYLKSDFGWEDETKEFRYFTPKEKGAISREHEKHENIKDVINLKNNSLTHYEKITIPQEKRIEVLRKKRI